MRPSKGWAIPKLWPGATVYIVGGGPSLKGFDLSPIHGERVIGCNQAYELGQWVDIVWFGDCRWFDWNRAALLKWGGLKITCCPRLADSPPAGVKVVRRSRRAQGIETDPRLIAWSRHTGGSALNVAYHLGAKRIVLLGYDMKVSDDDGAHWWHAKHQTTPRDNIYTTRFMPAYVAIKRDLDRLGVEVVNANPDSALDVFPRMSLEEAL